MDSIKLAGFKESLEKEASVGGLLRLTRRKATKLISKGKGALDDAKVGYEGGKSGIGWTPRNTAAGKAGQFTGKHRKAIAGTTGVASGGVLAYNLTKEADAVIGGITGAVRAGGLSKTEKDTLIKKYNLDSDSNLVARNAGRGALGGMGGGVAGGAVAGLPGALVGGMAGLILSTNKYSKGNARDIIMDKRNKK